MEEVVNMGILSIVPALLAIVLSFVTKNTIVALATACIVGTLLAGQGIFGFPGKSWLILPIPLPLR